MLLKNQSAMEKKEGKKCKTTVDRNEVGYLK